MLKKLKEVKVDAHSTANIQFTSGTTGMPKAAALSHFNLVRVQKRVVISSE